MKPRKHLNTLNSKALKLINQTLFLEWSELEALGVPYKSIDAGTFRFRKGKGKGWENISDPSDKRKNLVAYATIPAATVKACGLPTQAEMMKQYRAQAQQTGKMAILRMLPAATVEDLQVLNTFKVTREVANPATGELQGKALGGLPEAKKQEYIAVSRWLNLIALPCFQNKAEREQLTGCKTWKDCLSFLVDCARAEGVKLPATVKQIEAKLQAYHEAGAITLIHSSFGNRNAEKLFEIGEAYLIDLASSKNKPSARQVFASYQKEADKLEKGLEAISYNTVKRRLNQPETAQIVALQRDGLQAHKARFGYTLMTRRPSFSDAIWYIDGTKHNLYYQEADRAGKMIAKARLNMIAVMDGHSDCFLGWVFTEKEDSKAVAAAMRKAMEVAGRCFPHQVMWDNDGANKGFFNHYYQGTHFPAMPNNGQSKLIERTFGRFQDTILRSFDSFTGMNITARGSRSRVNSAKTTYDRHLNVPVDQLPTREQAIQLGEEALLTWNNTPGKDGKTPWERYKAGKSDVARAYTKDDELAMFYLWREDSVVYGKQGITLTTRNAKQTYEVYKEQVNGIWYADTEFLLRYTNERFWIKQDPTNLDAPVALYIQDTKGDKRFIAWANVKVATARAIADYDATTVPQVQAGLATKKEQLRRLKEKAEEAKQITQEAGFEGISYYSKKAYNEGEASMYEQMFNNSQEVEEEELVPVVAATIPTSLDTQYEQMMRFAERNFNQ